MQRLPVGLRGWIRELRRRGAWPDDDVGDVMCRALAHNLAEMGPHAAGSADAPSPGTDRLLATARLIALRQFSSVVGAVSQGIAGSAAAQLQAAAATEEAQRSAERESAAQTRLHEHEASRPDVPPVVNRVCAHPAFRLAIAVLCVAIETVITAPALEVLSHGKLILGWFPLEDVLAVLLGVATFMVAEVAAECLVTWLRGRRPVGLTLLGRLVRRVRRRPSLASARARRTAERGPHERAAGIATLTLVVSMLTLLGWFISVRQQNMRAARAAAAGVGVTAALGGLPGAPAAGIAGGSKPVTGIAGSGASASGPIAGLGGTPVSGQPIGPTTPNQDTEGDLGPVGGLSIVAFLAAFIAASMAGVTHEHAAWAAKRRCLSNEVEQARAARSAREHDRGAAHAHTPMGSAGYDATARLAVTIADEALQRTRSWEARVRELYLVSCVRRRSDPAVLAFPTLPDLASETERLLTPTVPDGRQVGGFAFGATPPADSPPAGAPADDGEAPPRAAPPHREPHHATAADQPQAPADENRRDGRPPRGRPDADDVLDALATTIRGMRPAAPPTHPAGRRRIRRFLRPPRHAPVR